MISDELQLRGYREGDLDALFALDVACFEETFQFSRSMMRRYAEARKARVVVAESGGVVVGFGILHLERGLIGYIATLDVALPWRRRGVAKRLMEAMELAAAEGGCTDVALHVFTGNDPAVAFYERLGYARVEGESGFYGRGLDAWVYRKRLD